jgi:tetratricopeptide (TPR) repeat protein
MQDPKNRQWHIALLGVRLQQTALLLAAGETSHAGELVAAVRTELETLVQDEPTSRIFARELATAWRLDARRHLQAGDTTAAAIAAEKALVIGESLLAKTDAGHRLQGDLAQSHLLAGRIARAEDRPEDAQRFWQRAREITGAQLSDTNDWRLLDPTAQALLLLRDPTAARPVIRRLQTFGYHAIDPLAASLLDGASLPSGSTLKD